LLAQFDSDWPPGFRLAKRCAIRRVAAGGDIPAAKLAVDRQIEHRKVTNTAFDLELRPDRPERTKLVSTALASRGPITAINSPGASPI
jgi:hypothetical protein